MIKEYCENFNGVLQPGLFGFRKNASKITPCIKNNVQELEILGPTYVNRVHWGDVGKFFQSKFSPNDISEVTEDIRESDSIGIHFYNKITSKHWGRRYHQKNFLFKTVFSDNCPLTYKEWYS